MLVVCVHPVIVLRHLFCVTCSFSRFVDLMVGYQAVDA